MVLADLGNKITAALRKMRDSTVIDETVLQTLLAEIGKALIQADVDVHLVKALQTNIRKKSNLEEMAPGANKRRVIQGVSAGVRWRYGLLDSPGVVCVRTAIADRHQGVDGPTRSRKGAVHPSQGALERHHVCRSTSTICYILLRYTCRHVHRHYPLPF